MKKIMFNDEVGLTKATLERRKTKTRRLMKITKPRSLSSCLQGLKYECMVDENGNNYEAQYYVGEVVAVAQRYKDICDYLPEPHRRESDGWISVELSESAGYRNKMFVKAELMPHQIKILSVHAERLQDITDEDCIKEGVFENIVLGSNQRQYAYDAYLRSDRLATKWFNTPREAFAALIDKTSGKGTWEKNPFVWVYEYELVR